MLFVAENIFLHRYPSPLQNPKSLPGALVLLAADAGAGWVPLGPTAAKAGRKVATVFADPSVVASDIEIYRTHTHELMVTGTGFNKLSRPIIDFDPPLNSADVYVDVSGGVCRSALGVFLYMCVCIGLFCRSLVWFVLKGDLFRYYKK